MATPKRTYGEACAAAHALDLVGDRWALLIVRELIFGPKRFTDLSEGIPNSSPNVISQRLRELEAAGVVERTTLGPPSRSRVYELTDWGQELETVLAELGRWGARSRTRRNDAPASADSEMLALRTLFDPQGADGFEGSFALHLGEDRFGARVSGGRLEVERGDVAEPAATIETDPATFAELFTRQTPVRQAIRNGKAKVDGDVKALARFLELFPLPEPAPLRAA